ncbi:MAG TPA: bifunctional 5,10-methylenetetrahydrofolate dehydrogenase/5,10-methenyltetrahydrofolate cyclohydrolase, partial [Bacillota bacterium]|nr:bifunctional 5,10-methylenetetrahydrofolate dehydrogenase/5,10-methenyltetrahydrofolate cyclohydrolase [Bacillota bacterium]
GFESREYKFSGDAQEKELLELINTLNADEKVDGILVQSPLPSHMNEKECFARIRADKDVDGFHEINTGKLFLGEKGFVPCTALGVTVLLKKYGIDPAGKECVIVGRSNLVGKPLALLMLAANATVTVCHSRTHDLTAHTKRADILVAATGKAHLITADMVKEGAVIIDVGITRTPDGLTGDVDFEAVKEKASFITPVPGGVGPMTIAILLSNTYDACVEHTKESRG